MVVALVVVVLSSTALSGCKSLDPVGGTIVRDARGEPTGVLIDKAGDTILQVVPRPSSAQLAATIASAQQVCLSHGLTTVVEGGGDTAFLRAFEHLGQSGQLAIRVYFMITKDDALVGEALASGPVVDRFDGHLTVRCIKYTIDGSLGSRGAALLQDYTDDAGNRGTMLEQVDELTPRVVKALKQGLQVEIHAIGDAAVHAALDVFAGALRERPTRDHRGRIEHAEVIADEDLPRFAELGVMLLYSAEPRTP